MGLMGGKFTIECEPLGEGRGTEDSFNHGVHGDHGAILRDLRVLRG